MSNIEVLSNAIKQIYEARGNEVFLNARLFHALIDDLVPVLSNERKIFRSVIDDTLLKELSIIFNADKSNKQFEAIRIKRIIEDNNGLSEKWSKFIVECFIIAAGADLKGFIVDKFDTNERKNDLCDIEDETLEDFNYDEYFYKIIPQNANILSLLKRTQMFLEDENFNDALSYADRILDIDPYCSIAYIYKLMAEKKAKTINVLISIVNLSTNRLFNKALSFSSDELKYTLERLVKVSNTYYKKRQEKINSSRLLQNTIISSSPYHTVGVCTDGKVWAVGDNSGAACDVSGWKNIVAVSAGNHFSVGVKADGHMIVTDGAGYFYKSIRYAFDLSQWEDIVSVSSSSHIVGLKSDGTVVAQGLNLHGECNVSEWKNIIAVSADYKVTVGLKSDGTVVATGNNEYGKCNTYEWRDIVAITTAIDCVLGLKKDGTLVYTEGSENRFGQCDVLDWSDIISIASNGWTVFGVKSDGTVLTTKHNFRGECNVNYCNDVVALSPMGQTNIFTTFVVKKDGTIEPVGSNFEGLSKVFNMKLFDSFDTWQNEFDKYKKASYDKAKEEHYLKMLKIQYKSKNLCQYCGADFKGFFVKRCTKCGREKDY